MSENQYFLIYKNENLKNYIIVNGPMYLPEIYESISGFSNLEQSNPSLLIDLSWANILNYGFWKAVFSEKPSINCNQKLVLLNDININEKIVNVSYSIENLTDSESQQKKEAFIRNLKIIRDRYLSMTDFTQLSDAPISNESKIEFSNFRKQLRDMFQVEDVYSISWPVIPTSANNIEIPPFPPIPSCN